MTTLRSCTKPLLHLHCAFCSLRPLLPQMTLGQQSIHHCNPALLGGIHIKVALFMPSTSHQAVVKRAGDQSDYGTSLCLHVSDSVNMPLTHELRLVLRELFEVKG